MESTRRPFDRSLSKEPGLKKPRLTEDPAAPDRSFNGRGRTSLGGGFIQRPVSSFSGGGGDSRFQRDRDSESSDSVRGPYHHQQSPQLHQELVTQYKTALAELTFNSKPIITNLTIIAGENVHAAKAIANTVCSNILEVPCEQKLPSLYLLDSIVKNIGRDYIKHFASRLPEVFCKAYRQVDPSIHPGMRHLFGTWKGVFPPQPLQIIEKELGIATAVNGSSSGTTPSRPDSQAQRPGHSIHVNPKYLEARQRLEQSSSVRGAAGDTSKTLMNLPDDVDVPERTSINSGRTWTDPYVKNIQRPCKDQVNEPACAKNLSATYGGDSDYGSDSSKHSHLGIGRASEKLKQHGKLLYESGRDVNGKIIDQQNGFDMEHRFRSYPAHKSTGPDSLELKKNFGNRSSSGIGRNWKNSEEEEYTWDDINSRPTDSGAVDISDKDLWIPDEFERLDFENHIQRPQSGHFVGSRFDDETSTVSLTKNPGQVVPRTRMASSLTQEIHPLERRLSGPVKNISGEGYHVPFSSSAKSLDRTSFQSQMGPGLSGAPSFSFSTNAKSGSTPSLTRQTLGTGSQSPMHQRSPSPSLSACNPNQVPHNFADQEQNSAPHLVDPRMSQFSGQRNKGPRNQFSQDSGSMSPQDVNLASSHRLQHQSSQTLSTVMPPQLRKHVASSQQKKLELCYGEAQKRSLPQNSGIENCSTTGKLSLYQPNPLSSDSPEQSITSTSLASVVKSEISSSVRNLRKSSFQGAEGVSAQVVAQLPLPSGPPPTNLTSLPSLHGSTLVDTFSYGKVQGPPLLPGSPSSSLAGSSSEEKPSAINPASNPVSSLLSSLVAKGLISASKKDSPSLAPTSIPTQPPDLDTGAISSSTTADSSGAAIDKPFPYTADELSSHGPDTKIFDGLLQSMTTKRKSLIGFEFKPDVVRQSHPAVVIELLDDLPHQCSMCGLRLRLQEQFDRHMEWHALRAPGQDSLNKISRKWYPSSDDWVAGIVPLQPIDGTSDLLHSENSEPLVPADESQCACILCGELFEDFYHQERGEWMFKGAVYLTNPSPNGGTENAHGSADMGIIVHADCAAEVSFCDSGLTGDIKLEKYA
ncbi:uncharacterized protein LOC111404162 [Olea europaea var. sylvestris]|uniref:uncharacterized protein LOC111404162 n=1 Tax=Olea europaea var. sylvestris TaxID=158386 RepID=UPI000C1D6060|nr:uncharacterized protein LOC111404162 [Olea europaea var. sylvestris]